MAQATMENLNIEVLIFDVFGTVVDWRSSVLAELRNLNKRYNLEAKDWENDFAQEWREGYFDYTRRISLGEPGSTNVDIIHRELLDKMLDAPGTRWAFLTPHLGDKERAELNTVWHRLGGWPDTTEGLYALKQKIPIAALSNGNVRLLVDMARAADLPWDVVFSSELFDTYKPNPKAYTSAASHLAVPPERCALVAAHLWDLRGAAKVGMKTIYVPRPDEDRDAVREVGVVKSKDQGGEVDLVVKDFIALSKLFS